MRAATAIALGGLLMGLAPTAWASGVQLDVKVVKASSKGHQVDPRCRHMERDFRQQGITVGSCQVVQEVRPMLQVNRPARVGLPGGRSATFTTQGKAKNGLIRMHVSIPGTVSMGYSVRNGGTYFLQAGSSGAWRIFIQVRHSAR